MVAHASARYSFREYLELEAFANVRHEYLDGVIRAMAGGTREHAALAARIIARLAVQLEGRPCGVHTSDLRIRVPATGLATYPDVTVVCGPVESDPADRNTLVNPILVVEVLSDSTEEYDRTEKLEHYKTIASLREIVLVSHREPRIDVWHRSDDGWVVTTSVAGETAVLPGLQVSLAVDAVYADPLAGPRR